MKQNLNGKVVVLTGAGGGIGRAIAKKLAMDKVKLVLLGGNNIANLEETMNIAKEYTDCLMIPGNLTDIDFLSAAITQATEHFGGIDILINNAGMTLNSSVEDVSVDQYDKIMNINIKVPFFLTQKALPHLKKSNSATIINIASIVGHLGYPYQSVYSTSKHALLGFTKSLANEYYKQNIRVHAICPGGVYTDMIKISRPDLTDEGMIMPEEIANIVYFFLENRGNAIIDEIVVHRKNKEPFMV